MLATCSKNKSITFKSKKHDLISPRRHQRIGFNRRIWFYAFPPRLPFQPIFYPVLNFAYAEQIARDWNTKDKASGFASFVTKFEIDPVYASRYEVQIVGAKQHQELWIPAEELAEFNHHLIGRIQVVAAYYGEAFHVEEHRDLLAQLKLSVTP